jgi:hypothetical protein
MRGRGHPDQDILSVARQVDALETGHPGPRRAGRPTSPEHRPVRTGATGTSVVVLALASQGSAQATCSARSLIPRSIFWLITKLTASTGSTRNQAHGRV